LYSSYFEPEIDYFDLFSRIKIMLVNHDQTFLHTIIGPEGGVEANRLFKAKTFRSQDHPEKIQIKANIPVKKSLRLRLQEVV
jgi:hypothetical protein